MTYLPPDLDDADEDTGDNAPQQHGAAAVLPIATGMDNADAPIWTQRAERRSYNELKAAQTQDAPPENPEAAPAPEQAAIPPPHKRNFIARLFHRNHAPMNATLATPAASAVSANLNDWQKILYAHARLNSRGEPVDETGAHVIDLKGMNETFGRQLAQTCLDLDAAGYKNQFYIMSGRRTEAQEDAIRAHYASLGSDHPVGRQGWSPHVYGIATDLQFTGSRTQLQTFYADFRVHGERNGLGFVKDDPNHVQIANAHQYVAQQRQKEAMEMAANRAPGRNPANPAA